MAPIRFNNICKTFRTGWFGRRRKSALKDVTFSVHPGEIFSIIGPNGAGKTTLLRILLGFIRSDSGDAHIMDLPATDASARVSVGYLPEVLECPAYLTPRQFLIAWGSFGGLTLRSAQLKAETVLELVSLGERKNARIGEFSKGMKLRLGLAQALLGDPEILVLDEPTDGLDAEGRILFRNLLLERRQAGKTILMNSHLLSEVEQISDRVGMLKDGVMVRVDNLENIVKRTGQFRVSFRVDAGQPPEVLKNGSAVEKKEDRWIARVNGASELEHLLGELTAMGATVIAIDQDRMSLEDLFVSVTTPK